VQRDGAAVSQRGTTAACWAVHMSRPGSPSGFSGYAAAASELSSSTWEVLSQVGRAIRASIPSDLEGMDDPANPDPAPAAAAFATMRPSPALDAAFARLRGHAGSRERARGNLGTTGAAPPGVPDVQLPEADRPEESTSYHQGQLEARDAITSYQNAGYAPFDRLVPGAGLDWRTGLGMRLWSVRSCRASPHFACFGGPFIGRHTKRPSPLRSFCSEDSCCEARVAGGSVLGSYQRALPLRPLGANTRSETLSQKKLTTMLDVDVGGVGRHAGSSGRR
jgi:hypothetical protein